MTTLFSDGFESGSLSAWTSSSAGGGGTIAVVAGSAHGGTKGCRITTAAASDQVSLLAATATPSTGLFVAQLWLRVNSIGSTNPITIAYFLTANDLKLRLWYAPNGVWLVGFRRKYNPEAFNDPETSVAIPILGIGAWHRLDIAYDSGTVSGAPGIAVYLDGALAASFADSTGGPAPSAPGGLKFLVGGDLIDLSLDDVRIDDAVAGPVTQVPFSPPAVFAFGDSFTYGNNASVPATKGYVGLAGAASGWGMVNYGQGGWGAENFLTAFISGYWTAYPATTIYYLGINDFTFYGTDTQGLATWLGAWLAGLIWRANRSDHQLRFPADAAMALSGSWSSYGQHLARVSSTQGDSMRCVVSGRAVYVCFYQQVAGGGRAVINVDGVDRGIIGCGCGAGFVTRPGFSGSHEALLRVGDLAPGAHTVTITVLGGGPVIVDYVAGVDPAGPVYVGTFVGQSSAPGLGYNLPSAVAGSDGAVDLYNQTLARLVTVLNGDGLQLQLADFRQTWSPATDLSADGRHPNDSGHQHLANALLRAAGLLAPPAPPYERKTAR